MTATPDVREVIPAEPDRRPDVRPVVRRSPARTLLPFALLVVTLGALVRIASFPLGNNDTFFHLRFGHEFLSGAWSLRHPGSVTTFATADWLPTQWLPQIVMAQFEEWFGLPGVAWLAGLQFLTLALTLWWACRRQAEPAVAALIVVLALVACTSGMSMRPQQISYILVVLTTATWIRARTTGRAPWQLVPITWVWVMCHGMWPVGLVIGGVAVVGLALDRQHPPGKLLRMAAVPVASFAVALVTPVGPGIVGAVLSVSSRSSDYYYEWGPPDFTRFYSVALLVLLALTLLPRMRRGRVEWFWIALIALAAAWAVYSLRTVPVSACLAAPLAAAALQPSLGQRSRVTRSERSFVVGSYLAALAVLAVVVPHTAAEPQAHPDWMDEVLPTLPAGTTVLEDSGTGGYMMWRFPELNVVAHGYGDAYTDSELAHVNTIETVEAGWVDLVRDTGAEYAVVDPDSPLGYALIHTEHWTVQQDDPDLVMLRAPAGWLDQ